jgi:hypothetical protein
MPVRLLLNYNNEEIKVSFEESEIKILEDFLSCAREIESCKIVQITMPFNFKWFWDNQSKKITSELKIPDWELMQAYLHRLRPIVLQKEKTYFLKICKILKRGFESPILRKMIDEEIMLYKGAKIESIQKIKINERNLISEEMFKEYINAFEYHRDDSFREKLNKIDEVINTKFIFYWLSQEKGGSILRVAEFVRPLIDFLKGVKSKPINTNLLSFRF